MIRGRAQSIHEQNEKNRAEQQKRELPLYKSTDTKTLHNSNFSQNYSLKNDAPGPVTDGSIQRV